MRPLLLAAALAAATAATTSPAHAAVCAATADAPSTPGAQVIATGHLTCATVDTLSLTVCVEAFRLAAPGWTVVTCETGSATAAALSVTAVACYQEGPSLVRTIAFGSSGSGGFTRAESAPVVAPGFGSCGP